METCTETIVYSCYICVLHIFFSAPGILELASNEKWADEFLTTAKEPMGPDWSGEFLDQKSGHGPPHPAGELRWAEEYLDHTEHRPW